MEVDANSPPPYDVAGCVSAPDPKSHSWSGARPRRPHFLAPRSSPDAGLRGVLSA